jgi:hypothetical protein
MAGGDLRVTGETIRVFLIDSGPTGVLEAIVRS